MRAFAEPDSIDDQLIAVLQENPQIANRDLAARIGIAASTCHARVRSLYERGIIRGQHLELAPGPLGRTTNALVQVRTRTHTRPVVDQFREHVLTLPEVVQIFHVSGSHDFILHVAVPSTEHLRDFLLDAVTNRPEVGRVETHLVFDHARRRVLERLAA